MDFSAIRSILQAKGYSEETADAKIAHDIILKAIADSGFHDNLTVKGGVVMSGITGLVRRSTMDMDVDFFHYPLTNEAIRRFVSRLNRVAPGQQHLLYCAIRSPIGAYAAKFSPVNLKIRTDNIGNISHLLFLLSYMLNWMSPHFQLPNLG